MVRSSKYSLYFRAITLFVVLCFALILNSKFHVFYGNFQVLGDFNFFLAFLLLEIVLFVFIIKKSNLRVLVMCFSLIHLLISVTVFYAFSFFNTITVNLLINIPVLAVFITLAMKHSDYIVLFVSILVSLFLFDLIYQKFIENKPDHGAITTHKNIIQGCTRISEKSITQFDIAQGYSPCANSQVEITKKQNGRALYKATYSFDEKGRRLIPVKNVNKDNHALIFFGGSRTFGEGVSDDETYPYYVSSAVGENAYMYAYGGQSPAQMAGVLSGDKLLDINEKKITVFYHFIEGHIGRVAGSFYISTKYHPLYPNYDYSLDNFIYKGTHLNSSPFKAVFFSFLSLFEFSYKVFPTGLNMPEEKIQQFLRVMKGIKSKLSKSYSLSKFIIIIHPWTSEAAREFIYENFRAVEGYEVIDASSLFPEEEPYIHGIADSHLSATGNQAIADLVVRWWEK